MTATALAIILLVNGMQILLPAPALLVGDYAYVPARAVLQYLGWTVTWDEKAQATAVRGKDGPTYLLKQDSLEMAVTPAPAGGSPIKLAAPPLEYRNLLYVPARVIGIITGAQVQWEEKSMTVRLTAAAGGTPAPVSLGQILADPPSWAGRLVTVKGEYLGWQAPPFDPATSLGPPATRSDWVLRDATGALYCTGGAGPSSTGVLSPATDRGRRLQLNAVVALADQGFPYLQVTALTQLTGLEGLVCYLAADRWSYAPGGTATFRLYVQNATVEPLTLNWNSGQTYDFKVTTPEGKDLWQWSRGRMFTQALQQRTLAVGQSYQVVEPWAVPPGLAPGLYRLSGWLNREISGFPLTFHVGEGG